MGTAKMHPRVGHSQKPLAYGTVAASPKQIHHHRPQKGKHWGAIATAVAVGVLAKLEVGPSGIHSQCSRAAGSVDITDYQLERVIGS
jgi:hypothetical protein